jgi:hypothetical protein
MSSRLAMIVRANLAEPCEPIEEKAIKYCIDILSG